MFILNAAIRSWRQRLGDQPDIQAGDLDELADHLREGSADLNVSGLSEEEAFLVSARRLGDPEALAGEFATAEPGLRRRVRLRWMLVGALAMLVLRFLGDVVADLSTGGLAFMSVGTPVLGWTSGLLRLTIFVIGGLVIWRILASDATAMRIRNFGIWSLGMMSILVIALAFVVAAATMHGGTTWFLARSVNPAHLPDLAYVTYWLRTGLLLLLPVVLILMLWGLVRHRRKSD